tara:strand:+ start:5000 stop:5596 length:597 start_codon:yes stop_codon:yes gene_type:complete
MYKVFFNKKPIFLINKLVMPKKDMPIIFIKFVSKDKIIKAIKSKKVKALYIYHSNDKKLWNYLFKMFPLVQAAGGLVENKNKQFLFIYRNNKWDLPKGKIEKKEKISNAAMREVMEETGVKNLKITSTLPMTYHFFNSNGTFKLKKTFWYKMNSDHIGELVPQEDEGIELAVWKSKSDLKDIFKNAYENIKMLFESIF